MSVYKLSASISNASSIANLDVRVNGILYACSITIRCSGLDALNDYALIEIGFGSTKTIQTNDTLNSIFQHGVVQQFLTSGGGVGSCTAVSPALKIPVFAGERIYMHAEIVAAGGFAESYLYVEDGVELKAARRRR